MASDSCALDGKLETHPVVRKLVRRIFVGEFTGRRYVECLQLYRDVILVDKEEKEFVTLLKDFRRFVLEFNKTKGWLGVRWNAYDATGYCTIWVNLKDLILGKHWFQVKSIKFEDTEISLELECLRAIRDGAYETSVTPTLVDVKMKEVLTKENVIAALRFSAVLLLALCAFAVQGLAYALDYCIKIIYAIAALIDASTPTFLGAIDFFGRCIAGFYWLILTLWKGNASASADRKQLLVYAPSMRSLR